MSEPFSLWDNPVFLKWQRETMAMAATAQQAENIVAVIDGRPPRTAQIDVISLDEIRVILVDRPEDAE